MAFPEPVLTKRIPLDPAKRHTVWYGEYAATGGYGGDAPPYQGHIVVLDTGSGQIEHVWNSLCSDRAAIIDPSSCPQTREQLRRSRRIIASTPQT